MRKFNGNIKIQCMIRMEYLMILAIIDAFGCRCHLHRMPLSFATRYGPLIFPGSIYLL